MHSIESVAFDSDTGHGALTEPVRTTKWVEIEFAHCVDPYRKSVADWFYGSPIRKLSQR